MDLSTAFPHVGVDCILCALSASEAVLDELSVVAKYPGLHCGFPVSMYARSRAGGVGFLQVIISPVLAHTVRASVCVKGRSHGTTVWALRRVSVRIVWAIVVGDRR